MFLLNSIPPLPPYDARTGKSLLSTNRVDNNGHPGPRIITTDEDGNSLKVSDLPEIEDDIPVSMEEMLGGKRQPSDDIKVTIKPKKDKKKPKK